MIKKKFMILIGMFACQGFAGQMDIPGGKIYYEVLGSGEPVIILHGGPGLDQKYLKPGLNKLAETNQVVFYDQRGCGKSKIDNINNQSINMDEYILDLENLRIHLGYEKINLLGHSFGGFVAAHYAIKYPENVKGLILLCSSPLDHEGILEFLSNLKSKISPMYLSIAPLFDENKFLNLSVEEITSKRKKMFATYFSNSKQIDTLDLSCELDEARAGFHIHKCFHDYMLDEKLNLHLQLQNLDIRTLIIHGKDDIIPLQSAENTHKSLKNSELAIIENCGHFPQIEQNDQMHAHFQRFLN